MIGQFEKEVRTVFEIIYGCNKWKKKWTKTQKSESTERVSILFTRSVEKNRGKYNVIEKNTAWTNVLAISVDEFVADVKEANTTEYWFTFCWWPIDKTYNGHAFQEEYKIMKKFIIYFCCASTRLMYKGSKYIIILSKKLLQLVINVE